MGAAVQLVLWQMPGIRHMVGLRDACILASPKQDCGTVLVGVGL